jgi:flagellar protein FlaF
MLNAYNRAADAYGKGATHAIDQREQEANALLKAARQLESVRREWVPSLQPQLDEAVLYNRKLWTIFAAEAANDDHGLPIDVKNNIGSISIFVFKRSLELQAAATPEKIDALIEINKNIAAGLMTRPETMAIPTDGGIPRDQRSAEA